MRRIVLGALTLALLGAASASTPPNHVVATVPHWGGEITVEEGTDLTLWAYTPGATTDTIEGWECADDWCTFYYGTVDGDDTVSQQSDCKSCHAGHGYPYNPDSKITITGWGGGD